MWNVRFIIVGLVFFFNQSSYAQEIAGEIVSVAGIAFIRPEKATGPMPKSPPRAKAGDNVYVGDVINTSSEAGVKILMRDKSIVDIGSSSLFKVDEYIHNHGNDRKAKLDLMFGKVRVAVTKKIENGGAFQVKTKGATMGVRGTEFSVSESIPASLSKRDDSQEAKQERQAKAEAVKKGEAPKQAQTVVTVFQGKVDVAAAPKVKEEGKPTPKVAPVVSLTAGTQLSTGGGVPVAAAQPVKLSETQLTALKVETKIADNTFAKAITIEPMNSNESSGGENGRKPNSEGSQNGGMMANIMAFVPKELPQISVKDMPRMDVMGLPPVNAPMNNVNNMMKRLTVTIVTAPPSVINN